jgi:hypothetical protein
MTIRSETISSIDGPALPLISRYLVADVTITAPVHNARLGPSFNITGISVELTAEDARGQA